MFPQREAYSLEDLFDLNTAKAEYADEWRKVYVQNKLDVIVGPGAETTAVPHDTFGVPPYTVLWNLLDVCTEKHLPYFCDAAS